jgi:hypothetical protein
LAGKRILAFGVTGIDKTRALARLAEYCNADSHPLHIVNFEKDFLFTGGAGAGSIPRTSFLDGTPTQQREEWDKAWGKLTAAIQDDVRDIVINIHGCYIRGHYGSRWILDPNRVASIRPELIVTLIADVYDMWWRTEERAQGEFWKGRPTLEQLVLGRRFEVAVGDQVALAARCKHLVLAVGHPCDTLARFIYKPGVKVAYLSFPISEPRRMARKNDLSGIEAVSNFVRYAHQRQKASKNIACVCPLAIDELPFVSSLVGLSGENAEFDRDGLRWNLNSFWSANEQLGEPVSPYGPFPLDKVRDAAGSIETDVGWRDYRLAEQASCLAVFNPVFNNSGKIARGVQNEVVFATRNGIPVYIFQDPAYDTAKLCESHYSASSGGTMPDNPGATRILMMPSLEKLFDAIEAL